MKWAQAPAAREQIILFRESLDDAVSENHPIRGFDAILRELDWSLWEAKYDTKRGQPAVHPRLVAGLILWGVLKGIRSSRQLEEATLERLDILWFLERRGLDHSTIAKFRVRFDKELKALTRQLSKKVVERCCESLVELILDGTRIRANSERAGARTAQALERLITQCEQRLQDKLERLGQEDLEELPETVDRKTLERQLEELQTRLEKYDKALEVARHRDAVKAEIKGPGATEVRVPVTDPDSMVMPNKEGGYGPNYTPVVAVEPQSRAIVYADVVEGSEESGAVVAAVEEAENVLEQSPKRVLADSSFATGSNLEYLEEAQVQAHMPTSTTVQKRAAVHRADARQAVAEEQWEHLPKRGGKLDRSAFMYDAQKDQYHCPLGKPLTRYGKGRHQRTGIAYTKYRCPGRQGCILAKQCIQGETDRRTLRRDQYQDARDRVDERMATEAGKKIYKKRAPVVEGVFGFIKQVLGVRQFLLRGSDKVRIEWNWICAAFNLRKLLSLWRDCTPPRDYSPSSAARWLSPVLLSRFR